MREIISPNVLIKSVVACPRVAWGSTARILHAGDRQDILSLLLALDPQDRRQRFHGCVSDNFINSYVQNLDFKSMTVAGVFWQGKLCAYAELFTGNDADWSQEHEGEFAVATHPSMRGQGFASILISFLKKRAVALGLGRMHAMYSHDNGYMKKLASRAGMFESVRDGAVTASAPLG